MKACNIYRTKKEYKIVTMYHTDWGWYISDDPIFFLPLNATKGDIASAISQAIDASSDIEQPSSNSSKELLVKMKERSWSSLYKNSKCCDLYIDKQNATIKPQKYSSKYRGLETDKDNVVSLDDYNYDIVVDEILRLFELE